jgi:hypothetical protein
MSISIGLPVRLPAVDQAGAYVDRPVPSRGNSTGGLAGQFSRCEVTRDDLDVMRRAIQVACPNDALRTQAQVFRLLTDLCFEFRWSEEVTTRILATRFQCLDLFKRLERGVKCDAARKHALISFDFLELSLHGAAENWAGRLNPSATESPSDGELGAFRPAGEFAL